MFFQFAHFFCLLIYRNSLYVMDAIVVSYMHCKFSQSVACFYYIMAFYDEYQHCFDWSTLLVKHGSGMYSVAVVQALYWFIRSTVLNVVLNFLWSAQILLSCIINSWVCYVETSLRVEHFFKFTIFQVGNRSKYVFQNLYF